MPSARPAVRPWLWARIACDTAGVGVKPPAASTSDRQRRSRRAPRRTSPRPARRARACPRRRTAARPCPARARYSTIACVVAAMWSSLKVVASDEPRWPDVPKATACSEFAGSGCRRGRRRGASRRRRGPPPSRACRLGNRSTSSRLLGSGRRGVRLPRLGSPCHPGPTLCSAETEPTARAAAPRCPLIDDWAAEAAGTHLALPVSISGPARCSRSRRPSTGRWSRSCHVNRSGSQPSRTSAFCLRRSARNRSGSTCHAHPAQVARDFGSPRAPWRAQLLILRATPQLARGCAPHHRPRAAAAAAAHVRDFGRGARLRVVARVMARAEPRPEGVAEDPAGDAGIAQDAHQEPLGGRVCAVGRGDQEAPGR